MRVLSAYDLDHQVTSNGATWLDRQLVSRDQGAFADADFGAEVRNALERRKDELIRQGHAWPTPEGGVRARKDLLPTLEHQDVERVGRKLAMKQGLAFNAIEDGQTIRGKLIGSTQLASGRFAMIDDGLGFSLVPWRPVIEKEIGREVMGVMRGGDVSWQLGRQRGVESKKQALIAVRRDNQDENSRLDCRAAKVRSYLSRYNHGLPTRGGLDDIGRLRWRPIDAAASASGLS